MADDQLLINFFAQKRYWHQLEVFCDKWLLKRSGISSNASQLASVDPLMAFWRLFALVMQKQRIPECIQNLQSLHQKRDTSIASIYITIMAHLQCDPVDEESIQELYAKLAIAEQSSSERAQLFGALSYWYTEKWSEAKALLERLHSPTQPLTPASSPMAILAHAYYGYICLYGGEKDASHYFDEVLALSPKDPIALTGKIQCLLNKGLVAQTLDVCHSFIASIKAPSIAATQLQLQVYVSTGQWEQVSRIAQQLLVMTNEDVVCDLDAFISLFWMSLLQKGDVEESIQYLERWNRRREEVEPKDGDAISAVAQMVTTLAGREASLLKFCQNILSNNSNKLAKSTLATVQLYQGNVRVAKDLFQNILQQDPDNAISLAGILQCNLFLREKDLVLQHFDLLQALSNSIPPGTVEHLESRMMMENAENVQLHLERAIRAQSDYFEKQFGSGLFDDFIRRLDLDRWLEVIYDGMELLSSEPKREDEELNPFLQSLLHHAQRLHKIMPKHPAVALVHTRLLFLAGHTKQVLQLLNTLPNNHPMVHILQAQCHLLKSDWAQALQSLDAAVSCQFSVRTWPLYAVVKSQTWRGLGKYDEVIALIENMRSLIYGKKSVHQKPRTFGMDSEATQSDRVSLIIEYALALTKVGRMKEAEQVMKDAQQQFRGSREAIRLTLTGADLALARDDTELALSLLNAIPSNHPSYIPAKRRQAHIFLTRQQNRRLYIQCLQEVSDLSPSIETFVMLGDAYMGLHEPDKAIAVYQMGQSMFQDAKVWANKIGHAFIMTHHYQKALDYYKAAVEGTASESSLRAELAELYFKLARDDDALQTIQKSLNHGSTSDAELVQQDIKMLLLQASLYEKKGQWNEMQISLQKAHDVLRQQLLISETPTHRLEIAKICYRLAQLHLQQGKKEQFKSSLSDTLRYQPNHIDALLNMAMDRYEQEDHSTALSMTLQALDIAMSTSASDESKTNALNQAASLWVELKETEQGLKKLKSLLDDNSNLSVNLIVVYLDLLRRHTSTRETKETEAQRILDLAQQQSLHAHDAEGVAYCRGLWLNWMGQREQALSLLLCDAQQAGGPWSHEAIYPAIDLLINPDGDVFGGEALISLNEENSEGSYGIDPKEKSLDEETRGILTDQLLKLLEKLPKSTKREIYEARIWMMTRNKSDVERAIQALSSVLSREKDSVLTALSLAQAFMLQKQTPRARNHLKPIVQSRWQRSEGDVFEQAWLLLADIYTQAGKYDLAQELLQNTLLFNKNCTKAHEYLGFIFEREQAYRDAATHYAHGWKEAPIKEARRGYRLAFNYLKARRYTDAIDVCWDVLRVFPEYTKLKKDILDKARANLRMPV